MYDVTIKKKFEKLEFVFILKMWTLILNRFDNTIKILQYINIDLSIVVTLYDPLKKQVQDFLDLFDNNLKESQELNKHFCYLLQL